jgi:ferric hydroxamate transport system substrate-binding protein
MSSSIAPTLIFEPYPSDESQTQYDEMRETLLKIADATGRRAHGEQALQQMEDKIAQGRAAIEAAGLAGEKFVLSQAWSGASAAEMRLFTDNAMATQIVSRLGLENGWDDGFQQYGFSTVSIEALPQIGDAHFFYVVQDDDNVFLADSVKPLWESLAFVKAGRAHALGGDTWLFGGPLSAQVLVDIILSALVPDAAAASESHPL